MSYAKVGDWNVICDVCQEKIKASEATERWDGLIVGAEHEGCFEHRHPLDFPRPPVRDDEPLPFTRPERTDQFKTVENNAETIPIPDGTFNTDTL